MLNDANDRLILFYDNCFAHRREPQRVGCEKGKGEEKVIHEFDCYSKKIFKHGRVYFSSPGDAIPVEELFNGMLCRDEPRLNGRSFYLFTAPVFYRLAQDRSAWLARQGALQHNPHLHFTFCGIGLVANSLLSAVLPERAQGGDTRDKVIVVRVGFYIHSIHAKDLGCVNDEWILHQHGVYCNPTEETISLYDLREPATKVCLISSSYI